MRHGLGTVPGAVTRGRRAARALRGAGSEAGALGWESEIRGSLRSQTAGSWEGDQGAGRGPRSHSSGGRPAFTSTCVHTPPPPPGGTALLSPATHVPPARGTALEPWGTLPSTQARDLAGTGSRVEALAWECL